MQIPGTFTSGEDAKESSALNVILNKLSGNADLHYKLSSFYRETQNRRVVIEGM